MVNVTGPEKATKLRILYGVLRGAIPRALTSVDRHHAGAGGQEADERCVSWPWLRLAALLALLFLAPRKPSRLSFLRPRSIAKQSGPTALSRPAAPQLLAPPETALPAPNAPVITHAAPSQASPTYAPTSIPVRAPPEPVQEPAQEPGQTDAAFSTPERLVEWVYNYSKKPTPWRVPAAVKAMRELGLFTDEEKGAFCTGLHRRRARLKSQGRI